MNFSWLPWVSKSDVDLALNRVYKDNLTSLMAVAAELSAGDVAKLQTIIDSGNADIAEANAILEGIIARHTAVRDNRVAVASEKVEVAAEQQRIARRLLAGARKFLGTR